MSEYDGYGDGDVSYADAQNGSDETGYVASDVDGRDYDDEEENNLNGANGSHDVQMDMTTPDATIPIETSALNSMKVDGEMNENGSKSRHAGFAPLVVSALEANESDTSTSDNEEEEAIVHRFTVSNVSALLRDGRKYSSPSFETANGWRWRVSIYFGEFGAARDKEKKNISIFLEMADVAKGSTSNGAPVMRPLSFYFDIDSNDSDKSVLSSLTKGWVADANSSGGTLPADRKILYTHIAAVVHDVLNSETKMDVGYIEFISRSLFKEYCITSDDKATFVVFVKPKALRKSSSYSNAFDSRKTTGMVGLHNQGATCYLNSLLQTLYHTRALRKAVYAIDTSQDKSEQGVALELQRLFAELQTKATAVSTQPLTKAFGWTDSQVFIQHDVQELLRKLLDKLEERMKGTSEESTIKDLFCGKYATFLKCVNVPLERSREEEFFDVQLDVRGCRSVAESFRKYIQEERLDGDNQYDAEGFGKQDAIKGVKFLEFPPVLHLHLKRFAYDYEQDRSYKIHDRYEFPEIMDLAEFVSSDRRHQGDSHAYRLHSVLVHSGNDQRGHYYAYVYLDKPNKGGKWYKFNDEHVSKVSKQAAVESTFGAAAAVMPEAHSMNSHSKRFRSSSFDVFDQSSAYMLVYVRESMWTEIMGQVDSVPKDLLDRFDRDVKLKQHEREQAERRRTMGTMEVVFESDILAFTDLRPTRLFANNDWVDWDTATTIEYGDTRSATHQDVYDAVRKAFPDRLGDNTPFNIWQTCERENNTFRMDNEILPLDGTRFRPNLKEPRRFVIVILDDPSYVREEKEFGFLFREYDPTLPGLIPNRGKLVMNTGLVQNRNKVTDLWTCLATHVLGKSSREEIDDVVSEYELFELLETNPGAKSHVRSIKYNERSFLSDSKRDGNIEFELAGDIILYSRRIDDDCDSLERYVTCPRYFIELIHTLNADCFPLYPNPKETGEDAGSEFVQIVKCDVLEDSTIRDGLIAQLSKKLGADADRIRLTLGDLGRVDGYPLSESEMDQTCLSVLTRRLPASRRVGAESYSVFYEVLPVSLKRSMDSYVLRILVHLPPPFLREDPVNGDLHSLQAVNATTHSIAPQAMAVPKVSTETDTGQHPLVTTPSISKRPCLGMRWDRALVERVFVDKSRTTCNALFSELERRLEASGVKISNEDFELVLYICIRVGDIDSVVLPGRILDDSIDRCACHGMKLLGEDGRAKPLESFRSRMMAEFVLRPPKHVRKALKIAVYHCTLRDEMATPTEFGIPIIVYLQEGDSLGIFWRRLLWRISAPADVSQNWRPVLYDRGTPPRIVFLDVRASSGAEGGEDGAVLSTGDEITVAAALSNLSRSKKPHVGQDEYDSIPLWTRSEVQQWVTNDILMEDSVEDEPERCTFSFNRNLTFYVRHANSSYSAPGRSSTPVQGLTIRST